MFSRARKRAALIISASAAAAAIVGGLSYAAPAQAATATFRPVASAPVTATTSLTNRPDSGFSGNNWATDTLTRVAKAHLVAEVDVSNCPGTDTGHCYLWDGSITDTGTATTIAGQTAPGTVGGTEDQSLGVQVTGGAPAVQFYSSWKTARGNPRVPASLDGAGTAKQSTGDWMSQFFGSGAVINSSAGLNETNLGNWSWKYTGNFGFDPACPNDAYQWIDSSALGNTAVAGNILTPNANDCGTANGPDKPGAHTTAYLASIRLLCSVAKNNVKTKERVNLNDLKEWMYLTANKCGFQAEAGLKCEYPGPHGLHQFKSWFGHAIKSVATGKKHMPQSVIKCGKVSGNLSALVYRYGFRFKDGPWVYVWAKP